ncbi:uncharacterized protein M421DRAFT_424879 [Didymella exigua CBS 183.55]|uniref:ShKT domain-containing protein n=1 Tax=Didymella exigua CBS 183.55 TaxID=1150837 RepID=A0A6A5R924_9PLEO|nr:uncharacterized protein M421DRAFT_424879 [Didymella exigua CBS 183.55]KAF1924242.1 hypothetical protein M421DRAFT_424879 [Didymella exigua CBS 183.55]
MKSFALLVTLLPMAFARCNDPKENTDLGRCIGWCSDTNSSQPSSVVNECIRTNCNSCVP